MSNILIIKHGSLGDIVQASGVLQDIRNHFYQDTITILTSSLYKPLFEKCPYIDRVLVDERKPRWNLFYLFKLKKIIEEGAFSQVIVIWQLILSPSASSSLGYNKSVMKWI